MPPRPFPVAIALLIGLFLYQQDLKAQSCSCGPDFCAETPQYTASIAKKKQELSREYPARLVALFERVGRCVAAVERSPDGFSLFRQKKDGTISIDTWTPENERIGAADLSSGVLTECRVIITRHAFECCGSQKYSDRADYNKALDLNTAATLVCTR